MVDVVMHELNVNTAAASRMRVFFIWTNFKEDTLIPIWNDKKLNLQAI